MREVADSEDNIDESDKTLEDCRTSGTVSMISQRVGLTKYLEHGDELLSCSR